MLELGKARIEYRDGLIKNLRVLEERIKDETNNANAHIEVLNKHIDMYNEQVKLAEKFAREVVFEMEDYIASKGGGKWAESDDKEAHAYNEWRNAWEECYLDQYENEDYIDDPNFGEAKVLEELPTSPE
jgi:hypothetical protein